MGNLIRGVTLADGATYGAANWHALVEDAVPDVGFIHARTLKGSTVAADEAIIWDSEGNAIKRVTLATLLPAAGLATLNVAGTTPAVEIAENGQTYCWQWIGSGGNLFLQQRTNDSNNTLNATPFSVYSDARVIMSGTAQATTFKAAGVYPYLRLYEEGQTYGFGLVQNSGNLLLQRLQQSNDAVQSPTPLQINSDSTAVFGSTVQATGYKVDGGFTGVDAVIVVTGTLNGGSSGSRTLTFKKGILTAAT